MNFIYKTKKHNQNEENQQKNYLDKRKTDSVRQQLIFIDVLSLNLTCC
jgi:hypothetical protein